MTHLAPEKPKRKRKPTRRRPWLILILVGAIAVLSALIVPLLTHTVHDAVISSQRCDLDIDRTFLYREHGNRSLAIGNLNSTELTDVDDNVMSIDWFADGQAFIYQTQDPDGMYSSYVFDLEANEHIRLESDSLPYGFANASSDGNRVIQQGSTSDMNRYMRFVDKSGNVTYSDINIGVLSRHWSPNLTHFLSYGEHTHPGYARSVEGGEPTSLDFVTESTRFLGWVNDDEFVYADALGTLMKYDLSSETSSLFIEGILKSDRDDSLIYFDETTIGLIDKKDQFWVIDLKAQTHHRLDQVDSSHDATFYPSPNLLTVVYAPEQPTPTITEIDVIEIKHGRKMTIKNPSVVFANLVSESADYIFYWQNHGSDVRSYIQHFDETDKTLIETQYDYLEWITLDGQDYLYFAQSVVDDPLLYRHYLYNPASRTACLMALSHAYRFIWQPQDS